MYSRAVLLASSLLFSGGLSPAFAADIYAPSAGGLKDPVFQEEILLPEAAAYQEFAEWYIRGDVGIGRFADVDGSGNAGGGFALDQLDFDGVYSASIGFGRYLTPNLRLGLDIDYRHNASGTFNVGTPAAIPELTNFGTVPLEFNSTSLMLNAVYNFSPERRFSPYLGGGVGWAFHQLSLKGSTFTNDLDANSVNETGTVKTTESSSNSFAANIVTGVSVNIRQGLYFDAGYKFSYLGDADMDFNFTHDSITGTNASTLELESIMTHEFKIGLRYDLY